MPPRTGAWQKNRTRWASLANPYLCQQFFHTQRGMLTVSYLLEYLTGLFAALGCSLSDAQTVAQSLIEGELLGLDAYGLVYAERYYELIRSGRIHLKPDMRIVYQTPSTATLEADSALGPLAAKRGMELAIEKASTAGTGWVAVRGSNHFGVASYYSMLAIEKGMVGIAMTNSEPLVAPTNGTTRMLGTNPISVSIPTQKHPPLVFDFSTVPFSQGKLERMSHPLPTYLVQDVMGNPTRDASTLQRGGAMLPLGGNAEHGGHKGFCIGALVDIFSALFSGANFGPFVPPPFAYLPILTAPVGKGVGHFFGALRIDAFRPAAEFRAAVDLWIDTFRNAPGREGTPGVRIPGTAEQLLRTQRLQQGIPMRADITRSLNKIARSVGYPLL